MAGGSRVARLAYAEGGARQGVGAALGIHVARLAQTHVFQVAQEACGSARGKAVAGRSGLSRALHAPTAPSVCTCASGWAEAGEGAHTVDAGGSRGAGGGRTVIQVLVAALAPPAAHTHAVKATS